MIANGIFVSAAITVIAAAAMSAALNLALLPLLRRHALAHPNARSSHRVPTPQGGGIAVVAATLAAAVAVTGLSAWPILTGALVTALIGAADDLHPIPVAPRLALQTLVVAAIIASLPADLRVLPLLPWGIERALLVVALLWFVNLTNFMDGIDWMTVAEFVPLTIGIALAGWLGAVPAPVFVVALALGGALSGFAPFNKPVARLFLGDVGSLPIGLIAGWLLLQLAGSGHLAAAVILPLYYLADATLTLARRMIAREPFFEAHRTHFYQLASDRGLGVLAVVTRVFAVNVALVALASATVLWPGYATDTVAVAFAALIVAWLLRALARGKR